MTLRRSLHVILPVALAALFATQAAAAEKVTVLLDYPYPVSEHAGLQLGMVKGWYKEVGLDVDIQMGKGSVATIQQVAAGTADIGEASLSAMATSISGGLPVISIMDMVQRSDFALLIGTDTGYKAPADLAGKKIATASAGASTALLKGFFQKLNAPSASIETVFLDSTGMLSAYSSKSVDGIIIGTTYALPRVSQKRPGTAIYFSDVGFNLPSYGLLTRTELVKTRPDMLRKMVQINQRAWSYIRIGHEQEAVDAMAERGAQFRPDPKAMLAELKLTVELLDTPNTKGHPEGWQSRQDWENSLAVMQSVDLVKPGWKVDDYFDNRFIAEK